MFPGNVWRRFWNSKYDLPGVDIENVSVRKYNYAPYLSHIVGYTGQVQESSAGGFTKQDSSYER